MIAARVLAVLFMFVPMVVSFRSPDNLPNDVKLPTILVSPQTDPAKTLVRLQELSASKPFNAVVRKKWGLDNIHDSDYWYNPTIHTLGNVGFWGALHAALAPLSTKLIDVIAYGGQDVRQMVADELSQKVKSSRARVVDLCCGVGISTRALRHAFPNAETVMGIDTSSEMISMASFLSSHLSIVKPMLQREMNVARVAKTIFSRANAENTHLPSRSFDLVTVMYAFHEAPSHGRHNILKEAHRLLQPGGTLAVIDICTDYTPSKSMLAGEPYVLEYQKNIHRQLRTFRGFAEVTYKTVVPNHVGMWVMKRLAT